MSERKRMTIAQVIEVVRGIAIPGSAAEWIARGPGEFPAVCGFCGDAISLNVIQDGASVVVSVSHDVPLCPEFVQYGENL